MILCKEDVKKIGIVLLISLTGGTLLTYFTCRDCTSSLSNFIILSLVSSMTWFLIWLGNSFLNEYLSKKYLWTEQPLKRLIIGSVATIGGTTLMVIALLEFFRLIFHFNYGDTYKFSISTSIIITVLISMFLHGRAFLLSWRKSSIDAERLQKESVIARYESLKNQVNPHFLFNSLNALTNLVYEDPDKAVQFIKQLSEVYRYVLDTREREVVAVEDELHFLDSWLFLQKIRFGDNLKPRISVSSKKAYIAPLALQMLIENAIKHNVVSADDPLEVKIFEEDNSIVVENNVQKKTTIGEPSSGVGLENICRRYEFLGNRKVEIIRSAEKFTVKLPLIS